MNTAAALPMQTPALDVERVRADFPVLHQLVHGRPLVYLDNAATSQKPQAVMDAMQEYFAHDNANVHRAVHTLGSRATLAYEAARDRIQRFINAPSRECVIFTRGTTEGINLVVYAWGRRFVKAGDEILLTEMEHHSNLVPWQLLAQWTGATLRYLGVNPDGTLRLSDLDRLLTPRTKMVAFTHMSNVLGTINPVRHIVDAAHRVGAVVLVDAAQSVPHMPVDVQALDVDFLAFSGHKMCGPTASGALYGRRAILEAMDPFLAGGDMISAVWLDRATWNELPYKFEAGTPNIAQQIGLGAAVEYLAGVGMDAIHAHEQRLTRYALQRLREVKGLEVYGDAPDRGGVISFNVQGIHPHDLAQVLDQEGVAVRAGNHCAQPLHRKLGQVASCRASFYLYNTEAEVDALVHAIQRAKAFFGV
ncbi:MAG: cysteine desulfurase [Armatimonadota bacterium]|nr:cysteine desulfurase [Armatimonadota bacterium]